MRRPSRQTFAGRFGLLPPPSPGTETLDKQFDSRRDAQILDAPVSPFVAYSPNITPAQIVLSPKLDLTALAAAADYSQDWELNKAIHYLQEGLRRMTGAVFPAINSGDLSHGIVLLLGGHFVEPEEFTIVTSTERVLISARTNAGVLNGIVALLESVGYEVLGMGPHWVHVPDFTKKPLVFALSMTDRPRFLSRRMWLPASQDLGAGTLSAALTGESTEDSYYRWRVGTRQASRSIEPNTGHWLQNYHEEIRARFLAAGLKEDGGFLGVEDGVVGENASLDLSVPLVREVLLASYADMVTQHFITNGSEEELLIPCEPEDGGNYETDWDTLRIPDWYPKYRISIGDPLGAPYVLAAIEPYVRLGQTHELWCSDSPANTVFGFADFVLRELTTRFAGITTASGQDIRALLRAGLYSYAAHDVPPDFNIDRRIRVIVASYPLHRGNERYAELATDEEVAEAFSLMVDDPVGVYSLISYTMYDDQLPASVDTTLAMTRGDLRRHVRMQYQRGVRMFEAEIDLNFGKFGFAYWLWPKLLWDPDADVEALFSRWLIRAFGNAAGAMRKYYERITPDGGAYSGPYVWAQSVHDIDAALASLGPEENDVRRRLRDLQQYWYYYYLADSGAGPEAIKTFWWKSQGSYAIAGLMLRFTLGGFSEWSPKPWLGDMATSCDGDPNEICSDPVFVGSPGYTDADIALWWPEVLAHFPAIAVEPKPMLAAPNDLTRVAELQLPATFSSAPNGFIPGYSHVTASTQSLAGEAVAFTAQGEEDQAFRYELFDAAGTRITRGNAVIGAAGDISISIPVPAPGAYRLAIANKNVYGLVLVNDVGFTLTTSVYYIDQAEVFFYVPKGTVSVDFDWTPDAPIVIHTPTRDVAVASKGTICIPVLAGDEGALWKTDFTGFIPYFHSIPQVATFGTPAALMIPREIAIADGLTPL